MSTTTARFILQDSTEWGVRRIHGYPGDSINGHCGDELERQEFR